MENKASLTSLISAFGRIYHAENDEPIIFNDALSMALIADDEYERIKKYMLSGLDFFSPERNFTSDEEALKWVVQTQIAPTPIARSRYCEDSLSIAMRLGTTQYVILGAGLDTFAFRERSLAEKLHIFEVDHPLTQQDKKKRISDGGWKVPDYLQFVAVDFTKDDLAEKLMECGFKKEEKTFFSWLGVSYYLSEEDIRAMLKTLSTISADGSTLLFDFADEGIFTSEIRRVKNMLAMASAGGETMKSCFSYETLESILSEYRFLIYQLLNSEDIQHNYFERRNDFLKAFEHISYVLAVFK